MLHSLFSSWMNFVLVTSYLVNKGAAIRCYICGGEENDSLSCARFQSWDTKYQKECEGNNKSCQIQTYQEGNHKKVISRSCETIELDTCQVGNSIEYCFCLENLCNLVSPTDSKDDLEETEDFPEDFVEGSGIKNVDHQAVTQEPDVIGKSSSTKQTSTESNPAVKTNVIKSDKKYSSNDPSPDAFRHIMAHQ